MPPIASKHSQPRWANATGFLIHDEETIPEKDMNEVLAAFTLEKGIDEGSDGRKALARLL